jgi:hypothetical protein
MILDTLNLVWIQILPILQHYCYQSDQMKSNAGMVEHLVHCCGAGAARSQNLVQCYGVGDVRSQNFWPGGPELESIYRSIGSSSGSD